MIVVRTVDPSGPMRVTVADTSYKSQKDQPLKSDEAKKKGDGEKKKADPAAARIIMNSAINQLTNWLLMLRIVEILLFVFIDFPLLRSSCFW